VDLFSNDIAVTDLAGALRVARESRDGFVKLFNNSPVCMSMTTTVLGKRAYVRVNSKFLEKFGYKEEEIIGKTSVEIGILDAAESDRVKELIKEKGRLQNDYVKCIAKNGEIVHTVSSIEYMEMNGETHLMSFFVDISEIVRQQTIIEKHASQLESLNKELEAFSYSVSHDLRAPLRAINGYLTILEEDFSSKIDEEGRRLLMSVQRNARSMNQLIDDLLEFARLGRRSVQKGKIDMKQLVEAVLIDLNNTMVHKAEIVVDVQHKIMGDWALMKQVMVNLIGNAIKYSSKKEKPVVHISTKLESDGVIVTVRDNGAGFDMQYASKLFGVFQRLHNKSEFEGTGVGLAMVQRIINKHGGSIHAESEVGKGATFWFRLGS
jgi:PAS domain S-box-containing protein